MKVTKTEATETETSATLDLFEGRSLPAAVKARIRRDVGEYLVEQTLKTVSDAKSPVAGEKWPALSKEYKKQKVSEGGQPRADMELSGDMLQDLTWKEDPNGIRLGFLGTSEAPKADGHVKFSGKDNGVPKRRFIPGEGQEYVKSIQADVEQIILDAIAEEAPIKKSDLVDVSSKSDLYSVLRDVFGEDLTAAEIKATVLRAPDIFSLLEEMGLEGYL